VREIHLKGDPWYEELWWHEGAAGSCFYSVFFLFMNWLSPSVLALIGLLCFESTEVLSAPVAGEGLFSDPAIRKFTIQIAEGELEKLRRDNRTYVRATLTVGQQVFNDVAVRLKGEGSFRPLDDKPSFAVKFDEFVPGRDFYGLTKIMLNNSSQDRSYLSEYLCTSLYRSAGVPAPRVTHARVEFNGRELGFYVLIEAMNKVFLRQHFPNPNGPLYEGYARDIDKPLDQDAGPPSDQSDVRALAAAARLPPEERMPILHQWLEVKNLIDFLAVGMLIAQHDSYALNHNNYRLYRDPTSGRFTMIAHGIDGSFTQNAMPIVPPMKYILTRAILETPEGQKLYRERLATLFTNVFKPEVMTNRIQSAAARLHAAALSEQERTNIVGRTASFTRRILERYDNVTRQLADGRPAPATLNR
jgi:spore coat protein CotH